MFASFCNNPFLPFWHTETIAFLFSCAKVWIIDDMRFLLRYIFFAECCKRLKYSQS